MTIKQKQEFYRKSMGTQGHEMSAAEWQKIEYSLIHLSICLLVPAMIVLFWMVGGK